MKYEMRSNKKKGWGVLSHIKFQETAMLDQCQRQPQMEATSLVAIRNAGHSICRSGATSFMVQKLKQTKVVQQSPMHFSALGRPDNRYSDPECHAQHVILQSLAVQVLSINGFQQKTQRHCDWSCCKNLVWQIARSIGEYDWPFTTHDRFYAFATKLQHW